MASEGTTSRLPSGLLARANPPKPASESAPVSSSSDNNNNGGGNGSSLSLILAIIALLLAAGSFYLSYTAAHGLSANDKAQLVGITNDLRAIQQKQITLSSPLHTTVFIEKTFPASDIFPSNFGLPVVLNVPIDTTVTAQSNTGQIVPLHINDTLQVRTTIPIDTNKSLSNVPITISKEIPINTQFSVNLQVSAVYGKELNDLINRMDTLSQNGSTSTSGSP